METDSLGNREHVEKSLADIRDYLGEAADTPHDEIDDQVAERLFEEHGDLLKQRRQLEETIKNLPILGKNDSRQEEFNVLNQQIAEYKEQIRRELLGDGALGFDADRLKQNLADADEESALKTLGMLNEKGEFDYPIGKLSRATDLMWHDYLQIVLQHMDASDKAVRARITGRNTDNNELQSLDQTRTKRHDDLVHSLMKDLEISEGEENFAKVRRLVAKMRDAMVPKSGEMEVALRGFRQKAQEEIDKIEGEAA